MRFLWDGVKGDSKISRFKWFDVSKHKKYGLSVSDLWLVTLTQFVKWRWLLILSASVLWCDILVARHNDLIVPSLTGVDFWHYVLFLLGGKECTFLDPKKMTPLVDLRMRSTRKWNRVFIPVFGWIPKSGISSKD